MIIRRGQASWRHLTRVFCTSSHTHTHTRRYTARTHKPWPGQAISAVAITHDRRQETGNIAATSLSNFKRCTLFATCNICAAKFFRFSAADNKTLHCSRWGKATSEKPEAAEAARINCACVCCALPPLLPAIFLASIRLQLPEDAADKMLIRQIRPDTADRDSNSNRSRSRP